MTAGVSTAATQILSTDHKLNVASGEKIAFSLH